MRILKRSLSRTGVLLAVLAAALATVLAGCGGAGIGGSGAAGPLADVDLSDASFTVGSKAFTEQQILGQISIQALEATGASIEDRTGQAGSDATRLSLENGDIDMYWEYTGTNWILHLSNTDPVFPEKKQYEVAKKGELKENDIVLLERAPFNNTYALAMRSNAPEEVPALKGVTKMSDLKPLVEKNPDAASICVESEFSTTNDGLPGTEKHYGFKFPEDNVHIFDTGVVYDRTAAGDPCNFGEVFTTDGRIAALDLTLLEDDKNFYPTYNPAVNVRKETYEEYGDQLDAVFTPVSKALNTENMREMNTAVDVDGELPEDVAEQWLQDNGFIE